MIKRILTILLLCMAVIVLAPETALSFPLPSGSLMIDHTPAPELATPMPRSPSPPQPSTSPPTVKTNSPKPQSPLPKAQLPAPVDPYDYDALREANHEIYGAGK